MRSKHNILPLVGKANKQEYCTQRRRFGESLYGWMDGWMNELMDAVAAADAIHCLVPGLIVSQGFEFYVSSSAQGFFNGFCNV
jgi:hypothetical protein